MKIFRFLTAPAPAAWHDFSLLLVRICFGGLLLANHGLGKLPRLTAEEIRFLNFLGIGSRASLGLAVFAEVVCSSLIILGLLTRFATIPIIITMFTVIFFVHINDGLKAMELPILFLASMILLLVKGPGRYSIDQKLF
jgi:putative oxidoreductase